MTKVSIEQLQSTLDDLAARVSDTGISTRDRKALEAELRAAVDRLGDMLTALDPIRQPVSVFDPSNPKIIGRIVALALVAQARHPLSEIPKTYGSGVYALYYKGEHASYWPISGTETPIYVGQAAPLVGAARTPREQGPRLSARLAEHCRSIASASGSLDTSDFEFRSLVVQSGWESPAEDYLIHLFRPVWNSETNLVYGLGKHGDSALTRANKRSPWDTLHPGRSWAAATSEDAKSVERIGAEIERHFESHPPIKTLEQVFENFIEELRQV